MRGLLLETRSLREELNAAHEKNEGLQRSIAAQRSIKSSTVLNIGVTWFLGPPNSCTTLTMCMNLLHVACVWPFTF